LILWAYASVFAQAIFNTFSLLFVQCCMALCPQVELNDRARKWVALQPGGHPYAPLRGPLTSAIDPADKAEVSKLVWSVCGRVGGCTCLRMGAGVCSRPSVSTSANGAVVFHSILCLTTLLLFTSPCRLTSCWQLVSTRKEAAISTLPTTRKKRSVTSGLRSTTKTTAGASTKATRLIKREYR